ncbi:MAG: gliding motility protein GldC [Chitinophagales bacterium]|nr:gliding motility protein GldC [Chitinophagales bacterium]
MDTGKSSEIKIIVDLNDKKIPEKINWLATDSSSPALQDTKAFLLSLWDPHYEEALRIDLWTKDMRMDEMNKFFFQTLLGLSETYLRASQDEAIANQMREFAYAFGEKVEVIQKKS